VRISKASSAMAGLNRHLWRKSNIILITKLRVFSALVSFVMLYGAKTWQASPASSRTLTCFIQKAWGWSKVCDGSTEAVSVFDKQSSASHYGLKICCKYLHIYPPYDFLTTSELGRAKPVWVVDYGKHQTEWNTNVRLGLMWIKEADLTLYAK
jgi:hypothetical protein